MDPPAPSLISRLPLLDLPTETKAHIVKLVKLQDDRYRTRLRRERKPPAKGPEGEWLGRGVNALFMVNKELSDLAAVPLFQVRMFLSLVSKAAADLRFSASGRQGAWTTSSSSPSSAATPTSSLSSRLPPAHPIKLLLPLLSLLSQLFRLFVIPILRNISDLEVNGQALDAFAGQEADQDASQDPSKAMARASFCRAAKGLSRLVLVGCNSAQAAWVLAAAPDVRKLVVAGRSALIYPDQGPEMTQGIAGLHRLERLELVKNWASTTAPAPPLSAHWTTTDRTALTSLRSLVLTFGHCDLHDVEWTFVEQFAEQLEELELFFRCLSPSSTPTLRIPATSFPRLRHLTIITTKANAGLALLLFFANAPIESLALAIYGAQDFSSGSPLTLFLNQHSTTFRSFALRFVRPLPIADMDALELVCEQRNITLVKDSCDGVVSAIRDDERPVFEDDVEDSKVASRLCSTMDEVLKFGLARSARLRVDGDKEGAMEMLPLLKGLAERMMVERD